MNKLSDWIIDCASGPFGSNLKVENFQPSGFPVVDGANLNGCILEDNITKFVSKEKALSLSRSIANRHDVIVTISGTLGQISFVPLNSKYEQYLCSQRQFRVTFDETKVDVEYLVYYFHTEAGQKKILSFANYVGVPALSQPLPNFKNIEVEFPPIEEQHKIAKILNNFQNLIILNKNLIKDLKILMSTIYDYWFNQFNFPNLNFKPYKTQSGKMIYSDEIKCNIPEGWEVKKLGDLIIEHGKSKIQVNKALSSSTNIPFFTSGEDILFWNKPMCSGLNLFLSTGGNASIKSYFGDAAYSTDTWAINAGDYTIYLYLFIDSRIDKINEWYFAGSGLKHLQKDVFKLIPICIPPKKIIELFNEKIFDYFQLQSKKYLENIKLIELWDFLLPLLMNGQIKLKNE